jgi:N-methylhydantoinase A
MLLGVDVGGTFTDAVLITAELELHTAKVPSTPSEQSVAVLEAVAEVLTASGLRAEDVKRFAHGMTVATNALLEGRTARTALMATAGFTDVIELARQRRPHLYRLCEAPPKPLVEREMRFAVPERMGPDGPLCPLDHEAARALCEELARHEPAAVAVSLLHSYANPSHERELAELIEELLPGVALSLSSELVGTFREYERTATTALDAALSPLLSSYLGALCRESEHSGLPQPQIMQSSGGLTDARQAGEHAALTVLSGPAGGVAGALLLAELADEPDVVCFDMGGTSCDVCLIEDSHVAETAERKIAGRPVALPALDIHTVGAGGGSIAWRDAGGALRVGPASAGADPGPACYGRGGTQPTVTDANLVLGRLLEEEPLAGTVHLDRGAAEQAVGRLAGELGLDTMVCAEGIVRVAETEMLGALRLITLERGIDPRSFALMPFGGAGPLHAAALADGLGISRILCPRASGVLCALGLAAAAPRRDVSRSVLLRGATLSPERLGNEREALLAHVQEALGEPAVRLRVRHELRYKGQSFELAVEEERGDDRAHAPLTPTGLRERFDRLHDQRYGYHDDRAELELVNIRVSAWGSAPALRATAGKRGGESTDTRAVVLDGEEVQARVHRGDKAPGARLPGPCVCALADSTLLIPEGWVGQVDEHGTILMTSGAGK